MSDKLLYAWVTPAFGNDVFADHTFVTSFDSRDGSFGCIAGVLQSSLLFWYCWGSYHETGGTRDNTSGYIGSMRANIDDAVRLVVPNTADSGSHGTIFVYGRDGVCHQLANQVLYATSCSGDPLTVRQARGYLASTFLYGTYGRQHAAWEKKRKLCKGYGRPVGLRGIKMPVDDFEQQARLVLGEDNGELLKKLLGLRAQAKSTAVRSKAFRNNNADEMNRENQRVLDEAAKLLGRDRFMILFGFPPEKRINLVDPSVLDSGNKL